MNILVTGGFGFIGSNLVDKLISQNHNVTCTYYKNDLINKNIKILDKLENFDACFHQAANNNTLDENKSEMFNANYKEPKNLFYNLLEKGCEKFIYASSTAIYGNSKGPLKETTKANPLNYYAESKLAFDEFAIDFAKENEVSVIGLRYCNIYGPGEQYKEKRASMIFQLYSQMISGHNPKIFKFGEQKRDWCYVKDVVDANFKCLEYKGSGIFNIGSGKSINFSRIINLLNQHLKSKLKPEYIDCPFLEKYQNNTECDITNAKKFLNWVPKYDIEQGIEDYVSWLQDNFNKNPVTIPKPL
jgi:ADP-L-glycero-D-manno-heptose 6-epimerase